MFIWKKKWIIIPILSLLPLLIWSTGEPFTLIAQMDILGYVKPILFLPFRL